MNHPDPPDSASDRLDSWKEIAVHLKRSVRTVQRWEREQGLPVRRHQHRGGQSVYALASELDAWWAQRESTPTAVGGATVLAVAPFDELASDPDLEAFGGGLAEELILELSRIPGLRVLPRSASFSLRGKDLPAAEAGQSLGARVVLEGGLRRSGDRVRVTGQLVDVVRGFSLASISCGLRLGEVFEAQETAAREIASQVRSALTAEGLLGGSGTANLAVEEACAQGRQFWNQRSKSALLKAIERFQEAIRIDPRFAAAHAGLADCWNMLAYYGYLPPKDAFPKAKKAAEKALKHDPRLAEAHASMAFALMFYDWNWSGAEAAFRKALKIRPDYPTAHCWLGLNLGPLGRPFEAIEHIRRAQELDPASPVINAYVAAAYYYARQYEQAIRKCRATLEVDPGFGLAWLLLGLACRQEGLYAEARRALERAARLCQGSADAPAALGNLWAVAGRTARAEKRLAWLRSPPEGTWVSEGHKAVVLAGLGRAEEALDCLDRAFGQRYPWLALAKADPVFDPLRGDPRFARLLRRIGLGD